MSEIIELPEINGIQGAFYDPLKTADQQSDLAKHWAYLVRSLISYDASRSICEHSINGNKIRFTKKVWVYEGLQYIEQTQFTHDQYHPQFYARKSATAKIEIL